MARRKFPEEHNQIAFLSKVSAAAGFHEVMDFLSASRLRYALIVDPPIIKSHMHQYWSTVKLDILDGEER